MPEPSCQPNRLVFYKSAATDSRCFRSAVEEGPRRMAQGLRALACRSRGPWLCFQYLHGSLQTFVTRVVHTYLQMKYPCTSKISSKQKLEKKKCCPEMGVYGKHVGSLGSIPGWNKTRHGICLESQYSGVGGRRTGSSRPPLLQCEQSETLS